MKEAARLVPNLTKAKEKALVAVANCYVQNIDLTENMLVAQLLDSPNFCYLSKGNEDVRHAKWACLINLGCMVFAPIRNYLSAMSVWIDIVWTKIMVPYLDTQTSVAEFQRHCEVSKLPDFLHSDEMVCIVHELCKQGKHTLLTQLGVPEDDRPTVGQPSHYYHIR